MRKKYDYYKKQPSLFDWLEKAPEPKTGDKTMIQATIAIEEKPVSAMPKNIREQYEAMKVKHPDAVLLFRVGDFYETFSEDAELASTILGLTLTTRRTPNGDYHIAGFPHHALDVYLPKLVHAGKRVAICEQLEDPKLRKQTIKNS